MQVPMNVQTIALHLFSDLTKMVTMQNLFHDGGFSSTGVTAGVIEAMEKAGE